jgi:hypothetical protein
MSEQRDAFDKAVKERDEAVLSERARVNGWWWEWKRGYVGPDARDAGIASGAPAPKAGK